MKPRTNEFTICINNLSALNDGSAQNFWLYPSEFEDADELTSKIVSMLRDPGDEWEIVDTELIHVADIDIELAMQVSDYIDKFGCEKVRAAINYDIELSEIEDRDLGTYDSSEDWAYESLESSGALNDVPDFLRNYIDLESYARDCRLSGEVTFIELGYKEVWVVRN